LWPPGWEPLYTKARHVRPDLFVAQSFSFRREGTTRFLAFRSHWQFDAQFCTPGEGHEKGGVEGEAGYFRRNHWVPLPHAADLDALNAQLLAICVRVPTLTGMIDTSDDFRRAFLKHGG
jgi:hypothetical protein